MGTSHDDDDDDDDARVVDVEARAVPFNEWMNGGASAAAAASESPSSASSPSGPSPPLAEERRDAFSRGEGARSAAAASAAASSASSRWTAARSYRGQGAGRSERWTSAPPPRSDAGPDGPSSFAGGYEDAAGAGDWTNEFRGFGGFGGFVDGGDGAGPDGRTARNRWREFMTGRFYGAYQEDLVRSTRAAVNNVGDPAFGGEAREPERGGAAAATGERRDADAANEDDAGVDVDAAAGTDAR
jgi:hypothetical protein